MGAMLTLLAQPTLANSIPRKLPRRVPTQRLNAGVAGNVLAIDGQSFAAAWTQWQVGNTTRIGLSDAAIAQVLGARLLSTADASQQPIQWFSETLVLPTRLVAPVRYLDITDLAQRQGWQLQIAGDRLLMITPAARVSGVSHDPQSWGDRVLITLDRPVTWQVEALPDELIITVNAPIEPAIVQNFKPSPANRIRSLALEKKSGATVLRLGVPWRVRPQLSTVGNQIAIDIGANYLESKDILWAPGLFWRQRYLTLGSDQFPVVWLDLDPQQANLKLRPILPNPTRIPGTASLFQTAQGAGAIAAINGGFFNRNNQLPLGAVRLNGAWASGPILSRGAIGWNTEKSLQVGRLVWQDTIVTASGQRYLLTTLNSGYVQAGIARYTSAWGDRYTTLADNETVLTVQNNQIISQQPVPTAGTPVAIPAGGYLLVVRSQASALPNFPVGSTVQLTNTVTPPEFADLANIVGGGPLLIQNGQIVLDAKSERFSDAFIQERAARSAIAQTTDGRILMVTVHDRINGIGPTLTEMAQLIQQLGAVNGLNLDGGSSTTLYLGGQILDRPLRSTARVHNGIGIFGQP
jgi:hypothetical protein